MERFRGFQGVSCNVRGSTGCLRSFSRGYKEPKEGSRGVSGGNLEV